MLPWEMTIWLRDCAGTSGTYAHLQLSIHRLAPASAPAELEAMRAAGLERSSALPNLYLRDATSPSEIYSTLTAVVAWLRGSGAELAVTWDFDAPNAEVRWPAVPVSAL